VKRGSEFAASFEKEGGASAILSVFQNQGKKISAIGKEQKGRDLYTPLHRLPEKKGESE